jgi:hypothetical protein
MYFFIFNLIYLAIALFIFFTFLVNNYEDKYFAISNKLYLFIYFFILQFIFEIFNAISIDKPFSINEIMQSCIASSLIVVIAFDVYGDLLYNNFFNNYTSSQKEGALILLILAFLVVIKILQCIISG